MSPARLVRSGCCDPDDEIRAALACKHPHDWIFAASEAMPVGHREREPLHIFVGCTAEIPGLLDTMHAQRGIVAPDDRTREINQDHAGGKAVDQLFQVTQRAAGQGGGERGSHTPGSARRLPLFRGRTPTQVEYLLVSLVQLYQV